MQTVNEIKLTYQKSPIFSYQITAPNKAAKCVREIYEHSNAQMDIKEYMYALLVNQANEVVHYYRLSEGGISRTVADLRLVFATALKCLATGVILAHNHPSGQLYPSDADRSVTQKFADAGKILDIPLLDHIILSSTGYYSFSEHGDI